MKNLSKMTKEQLINLVKEFEEKGEDNSMEELKEIKETLDKIVNDKEEVKEDDKTLPSDTLEKVKYLLDGATCIICTTNKGVLNIGYSIDIMNLLTAMVQKLKQKMPKDLIEFSINNGLCDNEADAIKNLLESIDKLGE